MTYGRSVAGLYGRHSQGLALAPLRAKVELSCLHSLAPPYTLQLRRKLKHNENSEFLVGLVLLDSQKREIKGRFGHLF